MKASERRQIILEKLSRAAEPLSASALASQFGVSRQIIVGDIALLRAAGCEIMASPRGYITPVAASSAAASPVAASSAAASPVSLPQSFYRRRIACSHKSDQTGEELNILVDEGCRVLDVIIEHPLYGELTGNLMIATRDDVASFLEKSARLEAQPLSLLTEGIHLHTIEAPSLSALEQAMDRLAGKGILLKD